MIIIIIIKIAIIIMIITTPRRKKWTGRAADWLKGKRCGSCKQRKESQESRGGGVDIKGYYVIVSDSPGCVVSVPLLSSFFVSFSLCL